MVLIVVFLNILTRSDFLHFETIIICFRSVLRRKNRFKKGSTGWKKYQNKLSNTNGRNTSAVQLPAQAAAMNTLPAEQPAQVDTPLVQSAQVDMFSACLELSNLSTEVLMGGHENNVPVPAVDDSQDRIYKPMTSHMVRNTGTPDAATDCIQALQSCPRSRAHQTQHRSNATDARLSRSTLFRVSSSNASFHPTAPRLSTHLPQMTGQMSSEQPAHQLELSSGKSDNVAFTDYLLASGFANSNFVGDKLPGC